MDSAKLEDAVVDRARAALHSGFNGDISEEPPLCRETQFEALSKFISKCFENCEGGGAYLSGTPGTGKSMTAHAVLKSLKCSSSPWDVSSTIISINCMGLTDAQGVYKALLKGYNEWKSCPSEHIIFPCRDSGGQVCNDSTNTSQTNSQKEFEKLALRRIELRSRRKHQRSSTCAAQDRGMIVIFLDEMDSLISRDATILQNLLVLAKQSQRLIVVGAANSLDLTERVMPDLKAQECQPELIAFPAYRACEASQVLHKRLEDSNINIFDDNAIELCARKVSAHSGDMRQVLEACTAAINIATADQGDSENRGPFLVGPREILQTLESMQDARSTSSTAELVRGLPTSQQILLFAIWDQSVELSKKPVLLAKPNQKKQPLKVNSLKPRITSLKPSMTKRKREHMKMSTIYCRYMNICGQFQLESNSLSQVHQMASCLHDAALIELRKGRGLKNSAVSLRVEASSLKGVFANHVLFRTVFRAPEL